MPFTVLIIAWVGVNLIFGALSALAASRWGRDPFAWLFLGSAVGPIAFLLLVFVHQDDLRRARPGLAGPGSRAAAVAGPRVLVPVDGSAPSERAVRYVVERLGPRLSEVSILGVLAIERAEGQSAEEGSPRRRDLEQEIQRHLGSAGASLRAAGLVCKPIIRFGDPATEILEVVGKDAYDLVVMGRRGRGWAAKALLGSVSEKVVREASCPVTLVS
ncbi:MAG: universal stress protein [Dehalococcoidia bacterium]